jgi:lysophospholipase L1-like esterase
MTAMNKAMIAAAGGLTKDEAASGQGVAASVLAPGSEAAGMVANTARRVSAQNIIGQQWGSRMSYVASSAGSYTWHQTFTVEAQANRFRFLMLNTGAAPMPVNAASVAMSDKLGTGAQQYTPSTGLWRELTWDGGALTTTIPVGTTYEPGQKWSDWINISTIARVDGGTLPVVMVRANIPTASPLSAAFYSYTPWATPSGFNNGRFLYVFRGTGNQSRPDNAGSFTGTPFPNPLFMGFEAQVSKPAFTFLAQGDSITEGAVENGVGNFGNGWIWQAISALRNANPDIAIGIHNAGSSSSDTASFLVRSKGIIAAGHNFDAVIYSPFSPNDTAPSVANNNLMLQRLAGGLGVLGAKTDKQIIWTPSVNNTENWDATTDGYRLALRDKLLSYAPGLKVIDMESALSNGATPSRFATGKTIDGTHPSEVGAAAMVVPALPVMQAVLDSALAG